MGAIIKQIPQLFRQDVSTLLLLPVLVIISVAKLGWSSEQKRFVILACVIVLVVPLILTVVGKFPIYYTWMTFLPLCMLTAVLAEKSFDRKPLLFIVLVLSLASGFAGLPARVAVALLDAELRNHVTMSHYVSGALDRTDVAFVDFPAYYPAKLKVKSVVLPTYMEIISPEERAAVTAAVLINSHADDPKKESSVLFLEKSFGGKWVISGPAFTPGRPRMLRGLGLAEPYALAVFRRAEPEAESKLPK